MHRSRGNIAFVPLYACERCGYTSAEFRPEAARLHRLEYPDCEGVMRIIFRSAERYRGELYSPPRASTSPEPPATPEAPPPGVQPDQGLAIREAVDEDQAVRLTLLGDLDLTAAEALSTRLGELKAGVVRAVSTSHSWPSSTAPAFKRSSSRSPTPAGTAGR